jgi:hypothetical protein
MTYFFGATICQGHISNFITAVALLSCLRGRCVPQNRPLFLTMNPDNGCDACMCLLQKTDRRHNAFAWAVLWTCPMCEKHFYCCDDSRCCTRSVMALSSRQQITCHNYNWHKKTRLDQIVDPLPATDSNEGKKSTDHIHLLNYATLLPALWEEPPIPYALLTMEGQHLDADLNFV